MEAAVTMSEHRPCVTRRALLRIGGVSGLVGLAGCRSSETGDGGTTAGGTSPFRSVTVEGKHLVVQLREDADVSEVTLIKPDGSLYGQREIASGVTTVRFQLVELELGRAEHYTPGLYELIAVKEDQSESRPVTLHPDIRIQTIRQYSDEDLSAAEARIAVVVENVGSAPTWIYDIVYRNAPNWTANDELGSRPGISHLSKPDKVEELLLQPESTKTYVGQNQPLRFSEQDGNTCDAEVQMTVVLGLGIGKPIEQQIHVTADGRPLSPDTQDGFLCSDVSIEMVGEERTPTPDAQSTQS